jgi:uncharacterized protein YbjT (DUF2867 family)
MLVITGATGHTGKVVAANLLKNNRQVRVIGRDAEKLRPLAEEGAEVAVGDMRDAHFLARAFKGASAAYLMIPPRFQAENLRSYYREIGSSTVEALREAGVHYVVNLSSLGAHLSEKVGPVVGLHEQEERLNKLANLHILHLRPTYFMENLLPALPAIKHAGKFGGVIAADVAFPVIAARDIGEVAAERLMSLDFSGHEVRELRGPADLSMNAIAAAIGKTIGRPVRYVHLSAEEAERELMTAGASADMARAMVELGRAISERVGISAAARTKESTTKTSLDTWLREVFVPAYNQPE